MAGALLTGLVYFLVMKGMKNVALVKSIKASTFDALGAPVALLIVWAFLSVLTFLAIRFWGKLISNKLFAALAVRGNDSNRRGLWAKRFGQLRFTRSGCFHDSSERRISWISGCALVLVVLLRSAFVYGDDDQNRTAGYQGGS